jgi:hypothetical protein
LKQPTGEKERNVTAERRYKLDSELTIAQHIEVVRARRRNKSKPKFERPEYVKARAAVLREGGFTEEADEQEATGSKRSGVAGHVDAVTRRPAA